MIFPCEEGTTEDVWDEIVSSLCNNTSGDGGQNPQIEGPCLLYTSPSPRDRTRSRMPSSA